jgi:SAM-dependent methyltransferase
MKIHNKFELVRDFLRKDAVDRGSNPPILLDVGCRGCELRPYVADLARYEGVDLFQNPQSTVDHVLDVSRGLPFSDRSYDYVVALDVVEHLDDFQFALEELMRVAKRAIFVMLPNMAHVVFRLKFLRTGHLSAKYDLAYGQGRDRHRWLTILNQSDQYMQQFASNRRLALETIWFNDSWKKQTFARACRALGVAPQIWVWAALYVFRRT